MLLTTSETNKKKTLKDAAMSIPSSINASKVFVKDFESDKCLCSSQGVVLSEMFTQQHPLIGAWLVISSISICFLSALLFIFN